MKLNVDLTELSRVVSKMTKPINATETDAFNAGKDAALNGETPQNCHFSYFEQEGLSKAWEDGKASV